MTRTLLVCSFLAACSKLPFGGTEPEGSASSAVVATAPPASSEASEEAAPSEAAPEKPKPKTCVERIGEDRSAKLVQECLEVAPATDPACTVENFCSSIVKRIKKGCQDMGFNRPALCTKYEDKDAAPSTELALLEEELPPLRFHEPEEKTQACDIKKTAWKSFQYPAEQLVSKTGKVAAALPSFLLKKGKADCSQCSVELEFADVDYVDTNDDQKPEAFVSLKAREKGSLERRVYVFDMGNDCAPHYYGSIAGNLKTHVSGGAFVASDECPMEGGKTVCPAKLERLTFKLVSNKLRATKRETLPQPAVTGTEPEKPALDGAKAEQLEAELKAAKEEAEKGASSAPAPDKTEKKAKKEKKEKKEKKTKS